MNNILTSVGFLCRMSTSSPGFFGVTLFHEYGFRAFCLLPTLECHKVFFFAHFVFAESIAYIFFLCESPPRAA